MSIPDDDEFCMSLLPSKKKKPTNFEKCIICQKDSKETLRKGKDVSIKTLVSALEIRQDDVYQRLKPDLYSLEGTSVHWHSKCYESCTSKRNLSFVHSRRSASSPTPSEASDSSKESSTCETTRVSRSQIAPTDWSKCLFCKNKTYKKNKTMTLASTFQAGDKIMQAAREKGDNEMVMILDAVRGDLVAAEARYHSICYASYISKSNLKYSGFHEGKEESSYVVAFTELIAEIASDLENGKAFETVALFQGTGPYYLTRV